MSDLRSVPNQRSAACTIISPNYLQFARTLSASYLTQHPGHQFFVLIVADLPNDRREAFQGDGYIPVMLGEIGLDNLRVVAFQYDILELNTNVKPTFLKYLFAQFTLDCLTYLDPDVFCYAPLTPVFKALEESDVVLTPHITAPIMDGKSPSEQDFLYNGTYNLGFIAMRRSDQANKLLDWWEERCLTLGFSEGRTGLFVDQKWMNLAPGLFSGVTLLRDPGCNMAYWNLHERTLDKRLVRGPQGASTLCFFHFSGIRINDDDSLSSNTDRYTLTGRQDLKQLFLDYKAAVRSHASAEIEELPYGFDRFSDGTVVTRLARRIYSKSFSRFAGCDPFDAHGPVLAFCRRLRLVAGKAPPAKSTWHEFTPTDRRVEAVHRLLRAALRTLGPNRYELLMRYLAHIAVLRNQSVFLGTSEPGE